jgi:hypothetical protein
VDAWSGLKENRVPSCSWEVFGGTAHDVHSKPKLFGPSASKTANQAAIPNSPALSIMEWGYCQRTSDPR